MDIENANRGSGSWAPGFCPKRCQPCNNPYCADEAMRAGKVNSSYTAEYALKHARDIAKGCYSSGVNGCAMGTNKKEVLNNLLKLAER